MATYDNVKKIKIGNDTFNLYNSGGTVTSVGITNSGGISVSGSPITTSGNISIGLLAATDSVLGGIKTGYSTNDKNYAVALDANSNKAYVNVPWTDTQVSSAANHYAPQTATGSDKTASASGATAAWSIDVVKGITIKTDGKGHITDLSVTSGKIPANPNTDKKVQQDHSTASNNYPLLASGTVASTTARTGTVLFNQNVYIKPSESAIYASAVKADQGVFNKLVAADATFTNATVVGLLDVQGELHTNSWTNANIANIGGSFYISPTVEATDTTTYPAKISITNNTSSWTVSITGKFATDFIKSGTATSGVTWPANSLVLITGDVVLGTTKYPLGTLKGTLGSNVTATPASTSKTITLNSVTDAQNSSSPSVLLELYQANNNANISSASFINGKISLYSLRSGSNDYKIGILLSSMGVSSNSIIDIYGGVQADPVVRIGHLAGLPSFTVGTKTTVAPTGWGIYTDNGYFKGTVASTSGVIGGWTIGASSIYNGTNSKTSTTAGTYLGTDAIRNYQTSSQYVHIENGKITAKGVEVTGNITATSGTIGGCVIENGLLKVPAAQIINLEVETITGGTRGTNNYVYLSINDSGSLSINSISKTDWRVILGNTFGIDKSGYVTASTGKIGGWKLNTNAFTADRTKQSETSGSTTISDFIILSDGNSALERTIMNKTTTNWSFVVGDNIGITDSGDLYASSAYLAQGTLGPLDLTESGIISTNSSSLKIFIGTQQVSFGYNDNITFNSNGEGLIGKTEENSGDYLQYSVTNGTVGVINLQLTSLNGQSGTFTNLISNTLTATNIVLGEQDLSTRLTNLGGGIEAVQANVNSLSANLSTNYYTKANIEAIQSTINNTITQNIGVVTQGINQLNSTIESMQNTFGVNVEFYFAKNSVKKWQMRLGKEVTSGKPNLNDIWVE